MEFREKKTILVLTTSFPQQENDNPGGGGFVLDLCKNLSDKYKIVVLTQYVNNTKIYEEWGSIKIHRFRFLPLSSHLLFANGLSQTLKEKKWTYFTLPLFFIFSIIQIYKLSRKYKFQIIHAHWLIPMGLIGCIFKMISFRKLKIIITSHGSDLNNYNGIMGRLIKKFIIKKAEVVTVVSEPLQEIAKNIYPNKDYPIIPMGINTNQFTLKERKIDTSKNEILFVGRLSQEKGVEYLLRAFTKVFNKLPDTKLTIIGDGVLRKELESLSKLLNISDSVTFLGYIKNSELLSYYKKSKCLVMPSLSEGSPVVLAEAMCSGSIIVSSDIPVFKNILINEDFGFICNITNKDLLAQTIIKALTISQEKRIIIQKNITEYAKYNFSWNHISESYNKLIKYI